MKPNQQVENKMELQVGQWALCWKTIDQQSVNMFGDASGDHNPIHFDAEYAKSTRFGRPIVHGILPASLIPALFASIVPGSVYLSQTLNFKKPLFIDETAVAVINVLSIQQRRKVVVCKTNVFKILKASEEDWNKWILHIEAHPHRDSLSYDFLRKDITDLVSEIIEVSILPPKKLQRDNSTKKFFSKLCGCVKSIKLKNARPPQKKM